MNRPTAYQAIAALEHVKELEKELPEALGAKLDECVSAIRAELDGKSSDSDSGDSSSAADSMDAAKEKTRERFKSSKSTDKPDDKSAADDEYKS